MREKRSKLVIPVRWVSYAKLKDMAEGTCTDTVDPPTWTWFWEDDERRERRERGEAFWRGAPCPE